MDTSLREALSVLLRADRDEVEVVDRTGEVVGRVGMRDLRRAIGSADR
jgi:CBS domain-containing protein